MPTSSPELNALSLADKLAVERTNLANERTFLAYFRTSIALLAGGLTFLGLELLKDVSDAGYFLLVLSPAVLMTGLIRYRVVRKRIRAYYTTV
ncbi:hypothetical protein GCM10027275_12110 [Rhabdobacter roseus]|uniref:Putative membrane protein n=1 Tax=Rhabdobacter roseus TaxID=1655419 RepID=A0A840TG34_9BACT|nr:DUF202 domain-containing protein [Rhabdobacter roseus]MBB5283126.1 putative membrane protein [Rhabdobacter roseus]